MSLWWQFEAKLFTNNYTNRVVHVLKVFSKLFRSYKLKIIYIFGHVLIVNNRCYGRCYVKKLIPLCTFLKFHTHLEGNSARSFQNVFDKSSRVLSLVFPRNWIFHEHRHILGYHTPLNAQQRVDFVLKKLRGECTKSRSVLVETFYN